MEEDSWFGHDKLWHFVACTGIVLLTYALLAALRRSHRAALALLAGAGAGAAKEAGDAAGAWPWCARTGCSASWRDAAADGLGLLAAAMLLGVWRHWRRVHEKSTAAAGAAAPHDCDDVLVAVVVGATS